MWHSDSASFQCNCFRKMVFLINEKCEICLFFLRRSITKMWYRDSRSEGEKEANVCIDWDHKHSFWSRCGRPFWKSVVLTQPLLLADAPALSDLQTKRSKGIKRKISKLLNKKKPNSSSKSRGRLMWEGWNLHVLTCAHRDGTSHHSHCSALSLRVTVLWS